MRTIMILTVMFFCVPAFGARYVRYDCQSYFYDHALASSYYHGCSAWYSPSFWNATDAKKEATDASIETCRQDSGENPCYLRFCKLERTDLYSPSRSCPLG